MHTPKCPVAYPKADCRLRSHGTHRPGKGRLALGGTRPKKDDSGIPCATDQSGALLSVPSSGFHDCHVSVLFPSRIHAHAACMADDPAFVISSIVSCASLQATTFTAMNCPAIAYSTPGRGCKLPIDHEALKELPDFRREFWQHRRRNCHTAKIRSQS
jgi:hypothetical protein